MPSVTELEQRDAERPGVGRWRERAFDGKLLRRGREWPQAPAKRPRCRIVCANWRRTTEISQTNVVMAVHEDVVGSKRPMYEAGSMNRRQAGRDAGRQRDELTEAIWRPLIGLNRGDDFVERVRIFDLGKHGKPFVFVLEEVDDWKDPRMLQFGLQSTRAPQAFQSMQLGYPVHDRINRSAAAGRLTRWPSFVPEQQRMSQRGMARLIVGVPGKARPKPLDGVRAYLQRQVAAEEFVAGARRISHQNRATELTILARTFC